MSKFGAIEFLWPTMLWLLLSLPVFVLLYLRLVKQRNIAASLYARLELVGAGPTANNLRRHIPALLMLIGLAFMILAIARPQAAITLPSRADSVILAMDTSGSMRATDIKPDRISAAKEAARQFIADQPRHTRIGVVAIASSVAVAQSPTTNREDVLKAIENFQLQRGTALGTGLVIALSTLRPDAGIEVDRVLAGMPPRPQFDGSGRMVPFKPVPPGSHTSGAIVLLSDGQSNTGIEIEKAAELAAERGVRIFTIGVGTPEGTTLSTEGWSSRVRLDEEALKKVALSTNAEYFRAGSSGELKKIYTYLSARLMLERRQIMEISAVFVAAGALFAMLSCLISLFRYNRVL